MTATSRELAVLQQASRMLDEAKSLEEIKTIRDKAEAARNYVKAAKLGLELQNCAAEVKLRAERKAGGLLRSLKLWGGDRKSKGRADPLKLGDLGVSRDQSKRWQYIARVSDAEFARYLKETTDQGHEITSAGLMRVAAKRVAAPRPVRLQSPPDVDLTPAASRAAEELLEELTNHCRLLGDILRPVCQGAGPELKRGERRGVGRLIAEMSALIAQLRETWSESTKRQ
jgi:hypothetical protein